jgi:SAM-dependent methyltransferase
VDLPLFHPSPELTEAAALHLRYQPFVVDDYRQTGVAYSWIHSPDPTRVTPDDFFFDRRVVSEEVWNQAWDANRRLANMYDAFVARIVDFCPPDARYLDVCCNTGYFPVRASLAGVRTAVGADAGDFSRSFGVLNQITGSDARFTLGPYDVSRHTLTLLEKFGQESFDVVSSSSFLCHTPDPLHFLRALSQLASRAVFVWSGFIESDELLIRYNAPNKWSREEFPDGFDDGTSISLGLLFLAMSQLGFPHYEELQPQPDWLPENWHAHRMPQYQKFRAFMFYR